MHTHLSAINRLAGTAGCLLATMLSCAPLSAGEMQVGRYSLRPVCTGMGTPGSTSHILLAQPLPAVHRVLGPLRLDQALQILAGPVFKLVQDPLHRRIAFELCTQPNP